MKNKRNRARQNSKKNSSCSAAIAIKLPALAIKNLAVPKLLKEEANKLL